MAVCLRGHWLQETAGWIAPRGSEGGRGSEGEPHCIHTVPHSLTAVTYLQPQLIELLDVDVCAQVYYYQTQSRRGNDWPTTTLAQK